ncbi:MAG: transglycosylase SLT domain-containing protein [Xanthobacteraceae bacterium]|nr:transglycosylase SLT domain-containing protein [Xanthobacteraceae bacterium]
MSVDAASAVAATANASRSQVTGAIRQAAAVTGTSFEYLLATAKMESNFDPGAVATTSSARGLFQFIDQTWLGTVKEAGGALGYGQYADAITKSSSGVYSVSDPAMRKAILDLRNDPSASAAMAGVLTHSNGFKLIGAIGRRPTDAELYMAHFMGVGGAAKLITNAESNPNASGAQLFPNAAAANRPIFYDRSGRARSVSEVYGVLSSRYASAARSGLAGAAVAKAAAPPAAIDNAAYLSSFPDARAAKPVSSAPSTRELSFRTLFQTGDRPQPVSPAVQRLWTDGSASSAATDALRATPEIRAPRSFDDLFSDRAGMFSS